jgi:hypothetical protein
VNWSLITASNDAAVLKTCLASSPCVGHARDFNVMRGFASAGAAYNAGIRQSAGDVLVFAHQDVYLPPEWDCQLAAAISHLSQTDPNWTVLGVFGITRDSRPHGHIYCTGLQKVLGQSFSQPVPCTALDEVVLVLRRSAGVAFDEQLPGFHFYGTDICLEAQQRGLNSYIIPAFCIHNTAGMKFLPWAFWQSYLYMRRKWWRQLPIKTPCIKITKWAFPMAQHPLLSAYMHYVKREQPGRRVSDPERLCSHLASERARTVPSREQTAA